MAQALTRRLCQLYLGLVLYGFSMALLVRARLGVMPWDVLHQGVARTIGGTLGTVSIVVGALVLLLWIPLRQRPGVGTVSNVLVIGLAVDASLAVLPHVDGMVLRVGHAGAGGAGRHTRHIRTILRDGAANPRHSRRAHRASGRG